MEPPEQPDAGKAGEILQGLLVARLGQKFEDVALRLCSAGWCRAWNFTCLCVVMKPMGGV